MYWRRISNSEREEAYRMVWEKPIRQLAKDEGVSDVALRKRLAKYDIPFPPRGYWAKSPEKRALIPIPDLPPINRESSRFVFGYAIETIDEASFTDKELICGKPFLFLTDESISAIEAFCDGFFVEKQLRKPTKWVQSLMDKLAKQKEKELEEREKYRYSIWYTPRHEQVVPFNVPDKSVKRVLRILDTLDKTLFKIEGSISEGEKYCDTRNKLDWRLRIHIPMGSFYMLVEDCNSKLQISFSKSRETRTEMICRDSDSGTVEDQLGQVLLKLCLLADKHHGEYALERRRSHRRSELCDWESNYRKAQEVEKKCKSTLLDLMESHKRAHDYRLFAKDLSTAVDSSGSDEERFVLQELHSWVTNLADSEDPFIRVMESREVRDVWSLSDAIRSNREKILELENSKPSYSGDELGLG